MDNALKSIKKVEDMIEEAMWQAVSDEDHEKELQVYLKAKELLHSLRELSPEVEKEHARLLSYCLIRIANAEAILEKKDDIKKEMEALRLAEISGNAVQIARALLALGIGLLNQGKLPEAEDQWRKVYALAENNENDRDMQQILGWTLIVRSNVLMGKSLYNQALELAKEAAGVLGLIDNYAGLAAANRALANAYQALGISEEVERCNQLADYYQKKAKEEHK